MILGFAAGLFWFCIFVFGQLIVLRIMDSRRPQATNFVLLGCLGGTLVCSIELCHVYRFSDIAHGGWMIGTIWAAITFLCLFFLYMPFYYTVAASLSVRTLVLLVSKDRGALPIGVIRERFVSRELVKQRLEVMRANGFLFKMAGENYGVTPKGRKLAVLFGGIKTIWRMEAGG